MRAFYLKVAVSTVLCATLLLALHRAVLPAGLDVKNCERCGRFWEESPSHMRLGMDFDGHGKEYYLCSPFCVMEELERHPGGEETSLFIVDFRQKDDPSPILINAERAFYLYGIEGDRSDSREPYVAAFQTEKLAQAAKKELGGELLRWEAVRKRVKKLTDEYEAPGPRRYDKLKRRD